MGSLRRVAGYGRRRAAGQGFQKDALLVRKQGGARNRAALAVGVRVPSADSAGDVRRVDCACGGAGGARTARADCRRSGRRFGNLDVGHSLFRGRGERACVYLGGCVGGDSCADDEAADDGAARADILLRRRHGLVVSVVFRRTQRRGGLSDWACRVAGLFAARGGRQSAARGGMRGAVDYRRRGVFRADADSQDGDGGGSGGLLRRQTGRAFRNERNGAVLRPSRLALAAGVGRNAGARVRVSVMRGRGLAKSPRRPGRSRAVDYDAA